MTARKNHRKKNISQPKTVSKDCSGNCERCHKVSDGVYVTPFFLSQQLAKKEKS